MTDLELFVLALVAESAWGSPALLLNRIRAGDAALLGALDAGWLPGLITPPKAYINK